MVLSAFFFLLFISDGGFTEKNCSHHDVISYLNLTKNNDLLTMSRPVKNYKDSTTVYMEVALYAILDVVEKDQKFIPYVWIYTYWKNEYISWDQNEFCGIDHITVPNDILWKPDITIEEMTERDKSAPTPYLVVNSTGTVKIHNDQVLASTCKMYIYQFPFDIQKCNLSFKSIVHTAKEIKMESIVNASAATEWSQQTMQMQNEWVFLELAISKHEQEGMDVIVYTITMKRRSVLYVLNILLPILYFLGLDVASYLISDTGGEKLGFQVTVLLAVTVLQLILNDILPATSETIPLIALYCIGIFSLMMLSLLETIILMYLIHKDSHADDPDSNLQDADSILSIHGAQSQGSLKTASENLSELLPLSMEGNNGKQLEESQTLEKVSDDLRKIEKTLTLHFKTKEEKSKGYWTTLAAKVNKCFFIFYVSAIGLFLFGMFLCWFTMAHY